MLFPKLTINCKGQLLCLEQPQVMGILNCTPDSFYARSRYRQEADLLRQAEDMLEEGAAILDIGGASSRPGAEWVTLDEELSRVLPAIEAIKRHFPNALLSIDTVWSEVARQSIAAGVSMVNDISAGRFDPLLYETVAALDVPYVLMHMKGQPDTMQQQATYDNVVLEVLDFFIAELGKLRALGIKDIILDPGFGFGKQVHHNYSLLKHLHVFGLLELPLLAGLSRKSMITRVLDTQAEQALHGTTALHMVALQQGARLLRVHDVKPAIETIKLWQTLENAD